MSRLYLSDAENSENSQIWLGRFPTHVFILPPLLCGELFGLWGAGAVPHLLGPGLGRLVWFLSPVVRSLWANSSLHEQFTGYSKFGAQCGDGPCCKCGIQSHLHSGTFLPLKGQRP